MHACCVRDIAVVQVQVLARNVLGRMQVIDPGAIEGARAANQSMDLVSLVQQLLRHVRAILTRDTRDEGALCLGHPILRIFVVYLVRVLHDLGREPIGATLVP